MYLQSIFPLKLHFLILNQFAVILHHRDQSTPSLHSALAEPPYNVSSNEDDSSSSAVSDGSYVDQSTAFALAFACVKTRWTPSRFISQQFGHILCMYGKKHAWSMVEALSATVQVLLLVDLPFFGRCSLGCLTIDV
jgi:hypothetical protein